MAFDAIHNEVHVQGNYSFLDFKPKTFIDIYVNLKTKNISMVQDSMCKFFSIPSNSSLPVISRIFNTIPLITYYSGVQEKVYHQFLFANPLGERPDSSKLKLIFKEIDLELGAKDYPFDKLILERFQKDLPTPFELVVIEKVKKREFTEADFIPTVKCLSPTKEVQEYFDSVYKTILQWIKDLS
eukprot:CAMPEP_0168338328 /NCGR_PEP_ID=MMETSP0213-20121227/12764_1 /TAXON_ID=151035 /ORGANISM="Euplotes harpa, Strain FSP1.4" /LENGTH=183 /DNA_ID=CAMNT_0008344075 /DNA_START=169 /DNA_END=720 /DNA_ORIENTATION=+